jgi:hypothetical protein
LDMVSADGKTKFTYSVLSHRVSLSSVSIILFFSGPAHWELLARGRALGKSGVLQFQSNSVPYVFLRTI